MKKLLLITLLGAFMSCSNTPTNVENPTKSTTIELQQLANADSTVYKVVELNNAVYILSEKDNLVVKQIHNSTGVIYTLILILVLILVIVGIIVSYLNQ
jgi:hypothetical protein